MQQGDIERRVFTVVAVVFVVILVFIAAVGRGL